MSSDDTDLSDTAPTKKYTPHFDNCKSVKAGDFIKTLDLISFPLHQDFFDSKHLSAEEAKTYDFTIPILPYDIREKIVQIFYNKYKKTIHSHYYVTTMLDNLPHSFDDEPAIHGINMIHLDEWYKHGLLHREGDKPAVIEYYYNRKVRSYKYFKNGLLDRDDKPAVIEYYNEERKSKEMYYKNGVLHRENDYAIIEYDYSGRTKRVIYMQNGVKHRDGDKPAEIIYDSYGNEIGLYYYKNGLLHRDGDKAAFIVKNLRTEYYKNGLLHRDGKEPAIIVYDKKGYIIDEEYYENGVFKYAF